MKIKTSKLISTKETSVQYEIEAVLFLPCLGTHHLFRERGNTKTRISGITLIPLSRVTFWGAPFGILQ